MITASFTLYQEILKDLYAFSPWKACELKKLNQMNFYFQYLDRKGQRKGDYNRDFLLALGLVMGGSLIDRTETLAVAKYDFTPDPERSIRLHHHHLHNH